MKTRQLFAALLWIPSTAFFATHFLAQRFSFAATRAPGASIRVRAKEPVLSNSQERADSTLPQKVETPMATDERLEAPGWWPTKRSASLEDFAGTKECARCHAKIAATQLETPMAHAASSAEDSNVLREHVRITGKAGRYNYTIAQDADGRSYFVGDGANSISQTLGWAFGLGNKGQTYVYQRGGSFHESRMSFYRALQGLDLTTGHAPTTPRNLEEAMGRFLDQETLLRCFGCHTTASTTAAGFDPSHLTPGVDCEACHGPGARHAALMDDEKSEEGRRAIFNPADLNPIAQVDFCGACHRTLNDVYEMRISGVANVRFQPYRLENSKCWGEGDARLTCIACHDPHKQLSHDSAAYDEKCLSCHVSSRSEKTSPQHPGKACPVGAKNCVTCHMPRVQLASMHAPFVDHRIRIVRAKAAYPD